MLGFSWTARGRARGSSRGTGTGVEENTQQNGEGSVRPVALLSARCVRNDSSTGESPSNRQGMNGWNQKHKGRPSLVFTFAFNSPLSHPRHRASCPSFSSFTQTTPSRALRIVFHSSFPIIQLPLPFGPLVPETFIAKNQQPGASIQVTLSDDNTHCATYCSAVANKNDKQTIPPTHCHQDHKKAPPSGKPSIGKAPRARRAALRDYLKNLLLDRTFSTPSRNDRTRQTIHNKPIRHHQL
ncbi:hypothetical protein QBC35DRAFT_283932 [Podospora australis]|uniref:Uncharacterized protein n=1 Tax=Podospora australis TaxID=1536484 RepID=A0AAN7AG96_9PEZI|nr:hypothetical protein QBC35DRAFT_283932 [Podospora australis]